MEILPQTFSRMLVHFHHHQPPDGCDSAFVQYNVRTDTGPLLQVPIEMLGNVHLG